MNATISITLTQLELERYARAELAARLTISGELNITPDQIKLEVEKPFTSGPEFSLSAPLPLSVAQIIWKAPHNKIAAINEARTVFGWGLLEAKGYVEHVTDRVLGQRGI